MKITREKIVDELVYKIEIICREFSNPVSRNNKENYIAPLPATKFEIRNILQKIVTALPVYFFLNESEKTRDIIKEYIVKEYILFQVQEDITAKEFANYLLNFISILEEDINTALSMNNFKVLS